MHASLKLKMTHEDSDAQRAGRRGRGRRRQHLAVSSTAAHSLTASDPIKLEVTARLGRARRTSRLTPGTCVAVPSALSSLKFGAAAGPRPAPLSAATAALPARGIMMPRLIALRVAPGRADPRFGPITGICAQSSIPDSHKTGQLGTRLSGLGPHSPGC
jgi:hypothetical protein